MDKTYLVGKGVIVILQHKILFLKVPILHHTKGNERKHSQAVNAQLLLMYSKLNGLRLIEKSEYFYYLSLGISTIL